MRINPLQPDSLGTELRFVHDEIANLVGNSQQQVNMLDEHGGLLGPFAPMLHFPQFGIPALSFLRTLDMQATLNKRLREVAILTVGGAYGARFMLYAHETMAAAFGLPATAVATLAAGGRPESLTEEEAVAHDVAHALVTGRVVPDATYNHAVSLLGREGVGELIFLIGGYCLIAMVLNGFDMPAPGNGG